MSEVPDELIVERYQRGDAAAFKELYFRHRIGTFNFVLLRVRERAAAEDLFQEIWIKVARAALAFQPTGSFKSWLYQIVRNQCIDHARKKARTPVTSEDEAVIEKAGAIVPSVGDPSLRQALLGCIDELNDDQKEVFLMRLVKGMTFAEITEVMGTAPGLANRRMQLAVEHLKRFLAEKGIRPEP